VKKLKPDPLNLIITGVGGQGNVLISQIIGRALVNRGFQVSIGETFGLSQRGGSVQSHVRISQKRVYSPLIPEGRAHVVLGLEPLETLRILPLYGRPDLKIVVNSRPIPPLNVIAGESVYPSEEQLKSALQDLAAKVWWLNGTAAAQRLGAAVMANIVLLGALTAADLLPLDQADLEEALAQVLPAPRLKQNLTAFRRGLKLIDS